MPNPFPARQAAVFGAVAVISFCLGGMLTWFVTRDDRSRETVMPAVNAPTVHSSDSVVTRGPTGDPAVVPNYATVLEEIRRRRENGDYVLDTENEALQARLRASAKKSVEIIMKDLGPEYAALFASLDLDEKTVADVTQHLSKVIEGRILAANAITSFTNARMDLENRLKKSLGKNYAAYEAYEAAAPVRLESKLITSFAAEAGVTLSDSERVAISEALASAQAFTVRNKGAHANIYTSLPPTPGGAGAIQTFSESVEALKANAAKLVDSLDRNRVSDAARTAIMAYYTNEVERDGDFLFGMQDPIGSLIRREEKKLQSLRDTPNASPAAIKAIEERIASLRAQKARENGP